MYMALDVDGPLGGRNFQLPSAPSNSRSGPDLHIGRWAFSWQKPQTPELKQRAFSSTICLSRLFTHLHHLSLRWHLSPKNGRGVEIMDRHIVINGLLSYLVFNILPPLWICCGHRCTSARHSNNLVRLIVFWLPW
ncbi:hypothetical protein TCAL_16118 [Tigriopus californicus]|uniref:Uncharacterized protein n=1 Tax=Tigriopus californicus TaxID=6832 RepID=A0A553PPY0_TIGCA|nr:hypothetical protein TCAL_16118 [Tigriopus californicus]